MYSRESYDATKVARILARISEGESLTRACIPEGLSRSCIWDWCELDVDDLRARYARARELQMQCLEEDVLAAADNPDEDPNRSRLKVDARKWIMARIMPKKYGDRVVQAHEGNPGGEPIKQEHTVRWASGSDQPPNHLQSPK
jgi:hypothetical protein